MQKWTLSFASLLGGAIVSTLTLANQPAFAQAAYGSYVGGGAALGLTTDENTDGRQLGAVVAARYKLLKLPISLRVQSFIGTGTAVVPTVSYDYPLNWQTDVYVGAGLAFGSGETPSPVGDKLSLAIQPGVDYMVPNSNTVFFGNAIIALDAYRDGGGTAVSVQGGVGLQF